MNTLARLIQLNAISSRLIQLDDRPDPGYWAKQKMISRATQRSASGVDRFIQDPTLIGERATQGSKKALLYGGAGAALGAGTGAIFKAGAGRGLNAAIGAVVGGGLGATAGNIVGDTRATKQFLKNKGIEINNWGNIETMTPDARKKYLHKKYRGGGVDD